LSATDTSVPTASAKPRIHALDGLRGAAAVAVVAFHVFLSVDLSELARAGVLATPLGLLVNGPGAVHVFFVLSGYVLAIALSRDEAPGRLARFYVRRVFRIHPAYMAAVLFAWAMSSGYPLWNARCGFHVPGALLPRALVFPSMAFGQLPVGWSLYVELAMSLVFPLLFLLARRLHPAASLAVAGLLLIDFGPRTSFLRFTLDFALGASLYLERERVARLLARLRAAGKLAILAAAALLLQAPWALAVLQGGHAGLERGHSPQTVVLMASGSALLVVASLHVVPLARCFETPLARFFGRISYSLYLVHLTVLSVLRCRGRTEALVSPLQGVVLFAVTLAISTALAMLGQRFVEEPAIRAGRALIRVGEASARRLRSRSDHTRPA
jgi:peptidoglycan/LPS O-acetylase OafA/YrhL